MAKKLPNIAEEPAQKISRMDDPNVDSLMSLFSDNEEFGENEKNTCNNQ